MKLGIPQIIYLAIILIELGVCLSKHGEPKEGTYNFITYFITAVITVSLLYCGGFFG